MNTINKELQKRSLQIGYRIDELNEKLEIIESRLVNAKEAERASLIDLELMFKEELNELLWKRSKIFEENSKQIKEMIR